MNTKTHEHTRSLGDAFLVSPRYGSSCHDLSHRAFYFVVHDTYGRHLIHKILSLAFHGSIQGRGKGEKKMTRKGAVNVHHVIFYSGSTLHSYVK